MTDLEQKSTLLPIKFYLIKPYFPFNLLEKLESGFLYSLYLYYLIYSFVA